MIKERKLSKQELDGIAKTQKIKAYKKMLHRRFERRRLFEQVACAILSCGIPGKHYLPENIAEEARNFSEQILKGMDEFEKLEKDSHE